MIASQPKTESDSLIGWLSVSGFRGPGSDSLVGWLSVLGFRGPGSDSLVGWLYVSRFRNPGFDSDPGPILRFEGICGHAAQGRVVPTKVGR